jgi:hypothetical protein
MWKLGSTTYSTLPDLSIVLARPGTYALEFSHDDFLNRHYAYTGEVRVLDAAAYNEQIVAPVAASLPLLYPNYYIYTFGGMISLAPGITLTTASNTFTDTIVVDYVPQSAADAQPLASHLRDAGVFYSLQATYLSSGAPARLAAGEVYSIALTYKEENVPASIDESNLGLYSWSNNGWMWEETSVVDVQANTVTATPNHFSTWAILAEENTVYLPAVFRQAEVPAQAGAASSAPVGIPQMADESCTVDRLQ